MRTHRSFFGALLIAVGALLATGVRAQTMPAQDAVQIDRLIQAAWKKENISPSPPADDARFLRRIYLQITGVIPPAQVISEFLADNSPDKRAKAIDALLEDPNYSRHWTEYWDAVLMGKQRGTARVDPGAFRDWLHGQLDKNVPYNQFVTNLITATGQNSTGRTYAEAYGLGMMQPAGDTQSAPADAGKVNGAVNWYLKHFDAPADIPGIASKVFLGVQIQCAQCHDHKTEKWKQDDFRRFAACFIQAAGRPVGGLAMAQKAATNVLPVDFVDINFPLYGNKINGGADRNQYVTATPTAIDGTPILGARADRRRELAAWMTSKDNPWFAQAIVNRMWSRFMGRGFVEPIDDFRPSNPAVLPEALKLLADDFVAHNYDTKYLIKTICSTRVYQLSPAPAPTTDPENKLWGRFRLTPMETDELLNSLIAATNFQTVLARLPGGGVDQMKTRILRSLNFVFDTDEEDMEQKEFEGTISQALLMLNGSLTNSGVTPIPGTALADIMRMPGDDTARIEAMYLRTVSRKSTPAETRKWIGFLNQPREVVIRRPDTLPPPQRPAGPLSGAGAAGKAGAGQQQGMGARGAFDPLARLSARPNQYTPTPRQQAYEDMFWALLNSSEFVFNH